MNRHHTLQVLVGVRQRRTEAFDQAVVQAKTQWEQALLAEQAAQDAVQGALAREEREQHKLKAMTVAGQSVDVTGLWGREHQLELMQTKVLEARRALDARAQETRRRADELRLRRLDAHRNRQKIEAFQNDLLSLHHAQQQHEDDLQDEESEETAVSRMVLLASPAQRLAA